MGISSELLDTIRKLSALETRTEDVMRSQGRIEAKLNDFIDRLSRIEANYEHMKSSVKNEIMADIKADLRGVQVYLEIEKRNLLEQGKEPNKAN